MKIRVLALSLALAGCGGVGAHPGGGDLAGVDLAGADLAGVSGDAGSCSTAATLMDGVTLSAQDLPDAPVAVAPVCEPNAQGPELTYVATVPAGQRLIVQATPNGSDLDLVLRVLSSCAESSCLEGVDDSTAGAPEIISRRNTGSGPLSLRVAVGSLQDTTTDTFDLTTWLRPAPANAACTSAVALGNGSVLPLENGADASSGRSAACESGSTGNVLYYAATIPAGATLTATVTPLGAWDVVLRLVASCGASSCLGSVDDGGAAVAETLMYQNASGAALPVLLAVGGFSTTSVFSLSATIQ